MYAARSTSTKEKKLTSPPSRRSFAKRSRSTVLASRNLRRKRGPKGFGPLNTQRVDLLPPEITARWTWRSRTRKARGGVRLGVSRAAPERKKLCWRRLERVLNS